MIQRFDGYIAQYLGDGLLVYFGYPQAHEDDAQRAVRTGLGMVEAMGTLNTALVRDHGVRLAVRVGIAGLVVVDAMGGGDRQEHLALGATPIWPRGSRSRPPPTPWSSAPPPISLCRACSPPQILEPHPHRAGRAAHALSGAGSQPSAEVPLRRQAHA